jgi:hypothetical protein
MENETEDLFDGATKEDVMRWLDNLVKKIHALDSVSHLSEKCYCFELQLKQYPICNLRKLCETYDLPYSEKPIECEDSSYHTEINLIYKNTNFYELEI